ncbi:rhodanese-like domain-containing protein [Actinoalloteichus spitiensis]|uniref:rhodanese-like domain-containing protein n=1 Tax=Actinoalloteichus spitiensis TaxID=252394 RepID=UPI00068A04A8|nr:rhodanese-like domain-containing protein [Actinoalloteichus spitiensis]
MTSTEEMLLHAANVERLVAADPDVRLVDVRTASEFETVRVPGSHNLPLDLLRRHRSELRDAHDDPVVLICATGTRARQARGLLAEAGLGNVAVLDGGISEWTANGHTVTRGRARWELERQVRLVAGSVVLASVLASLRWPRLRWVAAFVGGGLAFAGLTNTCGLARLLRFLPYNRAGEPAPSRIGEVLGASRSARR